MTLSRTFPLPPSLKVIGRKKVQFHLDDLIYFQSVKHGETYLVHWFCKLAEANDHRWRPGGVACDGLGLYFNSQEEAEEDALAHLTNVHRATGGQVRRPTRKRSNRRSR